MSYLYNENEKNKIQIDAGNTMAMFKINWHNFDSFQRSQLSAHIPFRDIVANFTLRIHICHLIVSFSFCFWNVFHV